MDGGAINPGQLIDEAKAAAAKRFESWSIDMYETRCGRRGDVRSNPAVWWEDWLFDASGLTEAELEVMAEAFITEATLLIEMSGRRLVDVGD